MDSLEYYIVAKGGLVSVWFNRGILCSLYCKGKFQLECHSTVALLVTSLTIALIGDHGDSKHIC